MNTFKLGDKVVLLTDPHAGTATFIEHLHYKLSDVGFCLIEWPSGVEERVHESELREAEDGN